MNKHLLPIPLNDSPAEGVFELPTPCQVRVAGNINARLAAAIATWQHAMPLPTRLETGDSDNPSPFIAMIHRERQPESEHYTIHITTTKVVVEADGPRGLFYALQTILQIAQNEGQRWHCRSIDDAPALPLRGLSLDISRGKVPTPDTLRRLVDRLASLKINHLQLYVEHTFDFAFDPDIARGCSGLTPTDIASLDAYCRERYIDFVPSLACFGHMGRVLSLPHYRHLAEIPADRDWESQPWPKRLRGLTINARDPEARKLLEDMLDEYLSLFSTGFANVGADETHDLGRGVNKEYCDDAGRGRLYIDHLRFLADRCRQRGKRMMFWGDVIRSFPELAHELPDDAILLDWGYEANATFPALNNPARAGRDVCVCPGTSGWNRLMNARDTSHQNIANAADAAQKHNATGLIVTDWGDHGHFNMLACSMPAIAHAAAEAWNPSSLDADALDAWLDARVFASVGCAAALRSVSAIGRAAQTWPAFYKDFGDDPSVAEITERQARETRTHVQHALAHLDGANAGIERDEWRIACHASALFADKVLLHHAAERNGRFPPSELQRFANEVEAFAHAYAATWNAANAPHRLHEITDTLHRITHNARHLQTTAR